MVTLQEVFPSTTARKTQTYMWLNPVDAVRYDSLLLSLSKGVDGFVGGILAANFRLQDLRTLEPFTFVLKVKGKIQMSGFRLDWTMADATDLLNDFETHSDAFIGLGPIIPS